MSQQQHLAAAGQKTGGTIGCDNSSSRVKMEDNVNEDGLSDCRPSTDELTVSEQDDHKHTVSVEQHDKSDKTNSSALDHGHQD
jgi:hypothetical protein